MRNAPSVSFPVGRSRFEGALLLALGLSGGAVLLLWAHQAVVSAIWLAGVGAAWWVGGVWARRRWRASPIGRLQWREGAWFFAALDSPHSGDPAALPQLRVALDLQQVLLLELPGFAPRWLWLARRDDPQNWNALRRAVHASPVPARDAAWVADAGQGERV